MFEMVLEGALLGLTLSLLIGPVFLTLLQTGIESGFRAGTSYSTGVWLSDFLIIFLMYQSMAAIAAFVDSPNFMFIVGIIGSFILIGFGLVSVFSKVDSMSNIQYVKVSYAKLFAKGFLINTFNPFTIFFWLGVNTMIITKPEFTPKRATAYFGSILLILMLTDLIKILLAKRIGQALKSLYIIYIKKVGGILLIISGIVLLYRVYNA